MENRTYAEVTCAGRNPTRRLCKTNNAGNNHKQNIQKNYAWQVQKTDSENKETI